MANRINNYDHVESTVVKRDDKGNITDQWVEVIKIIRINKKSLLLEDTKTLIVILNTGMLLLKLIRKRRIINYAIQEKHKHMNGSQSRQR